MNNIPIVLYIFWKQRQNWTRKSGWLLLVTLSFHKIDFFLKEVALPSKLAQQLIKERNRALSQNYVAIYRSPPLFVFASQFKWLFYKSVSLSVSLVALDCVQPALRKDLFTSKNASLHLRLWATTTEVSVFFQRSISPSVRGSVSSLHLGPGERQIRNKPFVQISWKNDFQKTREMEPSFSQLRIGEKNKRYTLNI